MAKSGAGHIFLSHSGTDSQAALQFAEILRHNGLEVWFDKDNLQPGERWMAALEHNIESASAMLVYVGQGGVQSWVDREVRMGLVRNTRDPSAFRLIPVLGQGADPNSLPPFLQQQQWVDLRDAAAVPEQIRRVVEILRASSSGQAQRAISDEYWSTHSPFRSLQAFEPEDSWLFFGRDADSDELLSRLGRTPVLIIVGNSGSGKSSLVRAGLIPALQRGRFRSQGAWVTSWRIAVFRPSQAPFDYLADVLPGQLAPNLSPAEREEFIALLRNTLPKNVDALRNAIVALSDSSDEKTHVLLVADQFEELFTLTRELGEEKRKRYVDLLMRASRRDNVHLVLSIRADFFSHCLEYPDLSRSLETNLYTVQRMNSGQLRETIERRITLAGTKVESGLIDSLLADVGDEPGDLALMEHALSQIWAQRGADNMMTARTYVEMGRLRGALGRHADDVCRQIGDESKQLFVQRIFLELVQLGEGAADTRRRVSKESLLRLGPTEQLEQLLSYLASNRLIQIGSERGESFVEVSHEALIRGWPSLRRWLADNREELRLERRLIENAEEWQRLKRDSGALLQGARLVQAEEWFKNHSNAPELVRTFIRGSLEARAEAERKEQESQRRELAQAQELSRQAVARASAEAQLRAKEHSAAVRFRWFSLALAVLLLVAVGAGWLARRQQFIAESRGLAAQAEQIVGQDRNASLDLAMRAWHTAHTPEAGLAVARAFPRLIAVLRGHNNRVLYAEFSPNGQQLVTAGADNIACVWNLATNELMFKVQVDWHVSGAPEFQRYAGFSSDGQEVITADREGGVRVWSATDGHFLRSLAQFTDTEAAISPDGRRVIESESTAVTVRSRNDERSVVTLNGSSAVWHAAFSPNGEEIVTAGDDKTGGDDKTARVWSAASGQLLTTLEGHTGTVWHALFSPNGRWIVTASWDRTARVWNAANGQLLAVLEGHTESVSFASFSPDGRRIVTVSDDQTARVWTMANGQLFALFDGDWGSRYHAAFSPSGRQIISDGRVLDATDGRPLLKINKWGVAFSPVSPQIVSTDGNTANISNTSDARFLMRLQGHAARIRDAEFSHDGQRVVTASEDNTARVWNAFTGKLLTTLSGHTQAVVHAEFSQNDQRIVTASEDNTARVWNAFTGKLLTTLSGHTQAVIDAKFSKNGEQIITKSADAWTWLWNSSDGKLLRTFHTDDKLPHTFPENVGTVVSPDTQRVITFGSGRTAQLWSAWDGKLLHTFQGDPDSGWPMIGVFSPDSQLVIAPAPERYSQNVELWNASGNQLVATLQGHQGGIMGASFSPDGQLIGTCSDDHSVRLWNSSNGQLLAILDGSNDTIADVEFAPDSRQVVTAGWDGKVRIYRLIMLPDLERLLAQ